MFTFYPKAIIFDFYRTLYNPDSDSLIPGSKKILIELSKKFPLILYSKNKLGRKKIVSNLEITYFFKEILMVEEKKQEDIFNIAKKLKIKTNEILIIGDRINSEIFTGKKAGCMTLWFKNGKFSEELPKNKEQKPDAIISKLTDALLLIKKK